MVLKVKSVENCYHCGDNCENDSIKIEDKFFCCNGCKSVYEILNQNNLGQYYKIEATPGVKKHQQNAGRVEKPARHFCMWLAVMHCRGAK
jgi:hypothetical protein